MVASNMHFGHQCQRICLEVVIDIVKYSIFEGGVLIIVFLILILFKSYGLFHLKNIFFSHFQPNFLKETVMKFERCKIYENYKTLPINHFVLIFFPHSEI